MWDLPYGHNRDGTFHRISTLSTTPREGDVYSCSVEHRAARRPLASSWGERALAFQRCVQPGASVVVAVVLSVFLSIRRAEGGSEPGEPGRRVLRREPRRVPDRRRQRSLFLHQAAKLWVSFVMLHFVFSNSTM